MITVNGEVTQVVRACTGWRTFDLAFKNRKGQIGIPLKALCEVYGPTSTGKSTFCYSLSSKIAQSQQTDKIALVDFETFDYEYMQEVLQSSGFDGEVNIANGETDEKSLDKFIFNLVMEGCSVGILDSIGAISPISEHEGSVSEANMGRRAKIMAQFSRKAIYEMRLSGDPRLILMTNHALPIVGLGKGTTTSGGQVKSFLDSTRIKLSKKEIYDDGSYLLQGKVEKNRFGYDKRLFFLFCLAGYGIHDGLTALMDCTILKLATNDRVVKLGDKSYGYMKNIITQFDDKDLFQPFIDALKTQDKDLESEEDE